MEITNIHNVPETLVKLAKTNDYSKNADYSVTEIISPPRIQRLRKIHFKQIQRKAARYQTGQRRGPFRSRTI